MCKPDEDEVQARSPVEYSVVVGSYDITKVKQVQGLFSKDVQLMLNDGWELRGQLHSSTALIKRHGMLCVYVTLVQNMVRINR